ncbi:hypothetical protein IFM89_002683 [Coptis chinensis]|uniref:fructose-bisphosphate aldolase n=1 Tax=Coptis chinensis TaxID=261450 RepID=A0A835IH20_9MAGN|nr:hypothetical protein IFM89_002683 [Coptis chinensis]
MYTPWKGILLLDAPLWNNWEASIQRSINENANGLAGMPSSVKKMVWFQSLRAEILVDGSHDIDRCLDVDRSDKQCPDCSCGGVLVGCENEEQATINLNAMNQLKGKKPWSLSFSFGRVLQQSTLKAWSGKVENVEKAPSSQGVRQTQRPPLVPTKVMQLLEMVLQKAFMSRITSTDEVLCFSIAIL